MVIDFKNLNSVTVQCRKNSTMEFSWELAFYERKFREQIDQNKKTICCVGKNFLLLLQIILESYGIKQGPLHSLQVNSPYVTKDRLQVRVI